MSIPDILKYKNLRARILHTIFLISIYRLGIFITLPYVNRMLLKEYLNSEPSMYDAVKVFNMFSGGAVENASIFTLGIMPYITSSIIISLLVVIFPKLKNQHEKSINNLEIYTYIVAIVISILQSTLVSIYLQNLTHNSIPIVHQIDNNLFSSICILTLTTGTIILIWISEKITQKGIGHGVSILIVTGILAKIPTSCLYLYYGIINFKYHWIDIFLMLFFMTAACVIIICIELGERRIFIYSTDINTRKHLYKHQNYLPIKINFSGVMPPILASTFLSCFISMLSFIPYFEHLKDLFSQGSLIYQVLFAILIFLFSYFYTINQFNVENIIKNMLKSNSFIQNIRPGKNTKRYIEFVLHRIIFWGALYLITLCICPIVLQKFLLNDIAFYFGGTGLLIIITVIIDILDKINNYLIIKDYITYKNIFKTIIKENKWTQ